MDAKNIAEQIFLAGVESVSPGKMIPAEVYIKGESLFIAQQTFSLKAFNNIYVIGAGKASAFMAKEVETILGDRITEGHIVTKYGHGCELKHIKVSEAGHPVPDDNGYFATEKILETANKANEKDLVVSLISGGGSALLVDFPEGATIADIITLNNLLLKSGAAIEEMNAVRKHLSKIKGGQLAEAVYPAVLANLVLSDVIGDPLDAIASGPTVPDTTTFEDAIHVLEKYDLLMEIPSSLLHYLEQGADGAHPETPKPGDTIFNNAHNIIVGNNKIALEAACEKAIESGLYTHIITSELKGDVSSVAKRLLETASRFQDDETMKKPCCLLFGGEPTIKVTGRGKGGRNQHLALCTALLLQNKKGIAILSAGTDGNDGPTEVAGAVVDVNTIDDGLAKGLHAEQFIENFDSYNFFKESGGHIITGPTMTNVMDIVVMIIE